MILKNIKNHIAKPQSKPIRLQEYGVGIFPTLNTKSALKKALKKNLIFVDGQLATTATHIYGKEKIEFHTPPQTHANKEFILKLELVFEDDYLAVIAKPAGILVSGNSFKTIDNALVQNLKPSSQSDAVQPRPVHRLDFATTGLLLIGKTSSSILALNKMFEYKQIAKTYIAVTIGTMVKKGTITLAIDDKEAISAFEVIETVPSERFGYLNLVQLLPKTGRRHQLRKHLLSIGNPILGDATYFKEDLVLKGKGMYLNASSLKFLHPTTNEIVNIKKAPPLKFSKLFETLN